eukprot:TRINITY_DN5620_c0_g1_i3.p1 TRINITY_DN5620_c0_g1~~TRINITY_DN5620_c0_g1_i3.p1  ORF type:complete len:496 (+),score=67.48 TRINITY_DN5620_c0_g1_i3:191-1489(+)
MDTVFLSVYAIGMFSSGYLGDRFTPKAMLVVGNAGIAVSLVMLGLARPLGIRSQFWFLFFWGCNGLFQSTGWPNGVAVMGQWFDKSSRGAVYGIWGANGSIGNILGGFIASWFLSSSFSWDYSFYFTAGLSACAVLFISFLLPTNPKEVGLESSYIQLEEIQPEEVPILQETKGFEEPRIFEEPRSFEEPKSFPEAKSFEDEITLEEREKEESWKDKMSSFLEVLVRPFSVPGLIPFSLCYFCVKLVNYSLLFWLPFYLSQHLEFDDKTAAVLASMYDIGGIVGGFTIGAFTDFLLRKYKIERAPTIFTTCLLSILFLYLYYHYGDGTVANMTMMAILGFLISSTSNLIPSVCAADIGQQVKNKDLLATVTGVIDGIGSAGSAFGQLPTAAISKHYGWEALYYFLMGGAGLAALCLTPTLLRQIIRRYQDFS